LIQAFDSGSHRKDQVGSKALECVADVFLEEDQAYHKEDPHIGDHNTSSIDWDHREEVLEMHDSDQHASNDYLEEVAADCLDETPGGNSDGPSSGSRKKQISEKLPSLCRMLMWIVNTNGCLREAFMRYFDEAQFSVRDCEPSDSFPCCDRHTGYQDLPAPFRRLVPVHQDEQEASDELDEFNLANLDVEKPSTISQGKRNPLENHQKAAVVDALRALRAKIWQEVQLGGLYSPFSSYTLISDQDIWILSTKTPYILDEPEKACQTVPALRRLNGIGITNIVSRFIVTMNLAVDSTPALQKKPRGRPPIPDTEFTLPHDIPSDADPADPDIAVRLQENGRAREDHDAAEVSRQRSPAWQYSLRHPPPLQMATRFRSQQHDQVAYYSLHDCDLESCPSLTAPAFHPPMEQYSPSHDSRSHSNRFQNDPQDESTLDPRILARLPKRSKGRPSTADKAARQQMIEQLILQFAAGEESIEGTVGEVSNE
jgi:hypothetical protein